MQQKNANREFTNYIDKITDISPSKYFLYSAWLALALLIGAEFIRRRWVKVIAILILSTAAVWLWAYYECEKIHPLIARGHARMSHDYQVGMLEDFSKHADAVKLSQAEIVAAIRQYIADARVVCHGEPYSLLEDKLWPKTPSSETQ